MNKKLLFAAILASSFSNFSQESHKQSLLARAQQAICGEYLITHARKAGCKHVEDLLQDLRKYNNQKEFEKKSKFASIIKKKQILETLQGIIWLKHQRPKDECNFLEPIYYEKMRKKCFEFFFTIKKISCLSSCLATNFIAIPKDTRHIFNKIKKHIAPFTLEQLLHRLDAQIELAPSHPDLFN